MKKINEVMFAANGNSAVFKDNRQIVELQEGWAVLFVKFLKEQGIKIDEEVKFLFPNGREAKYLPEYNNFMFL